MDIENQSVSEELKGMLKYVKHYEEFFPECLDDKNFRVSLMVFGVRLNKVSNELFLKFAFKWGRIGKYYVVSSITREDLVDFILDNAKYKILGYQEIIYKHDDE